MPPGKSTEPVWKTRIVNEWNAARNTLDVWVLLEEWDTDGAWLGKRVLGEDGHWREWITVEHVSLGPPTQTVPMPTVGVMPTPYTPGTTYPAVTTGTTYPVTTTAWPTPTTSGGLSAALEMEKEFIYGRGAPPAAEGSFDGQTASGADGKNYRWVAAQKRWLR